jgi:hypothetical protein
MNDPILTDFLMSQARDAAQLNRDSRIVTLQAVSGAPPTHWVVSFDCAGFVQGAQDIEIGEHFSVGIWFPEDYLRRLVNPSAVVSWLEPANIWHPNCRPPLVCMGNIAPGTGLVTLVEQLYRMISWQIFTIREDDALNAQACSWGRRNGRQFPADKRPLRATPHAPEAGDVDA